MNTNTQIGPPGSGDNERWIIVADSLAPTAQAAARNRAASVLDAVILAMRRKRAILGCATLGGVIAVAVALLQPAVYKSQTQILPPQQNQSATAALLGQLGELASLTGKDTGLRNPSAVFGTMLGSRTIADRLIERFDLIKAYRCPGRAEAERRLSRMTGIDVRKDGTIVVEVTDRNPARAAELANAYIEELHALSQSVAVTEAAQRRVFFEQQVVAAKEQLANAEVAMEQVQRTTGLIHLDSQAKAVIESIAQLRAQLAMQEVRIQQMKTFATKRNPELIRAQQELIGLREQLSRLESKGGPKQVGAADLPVAGLEYVRRTRDVKYYETMFELLAKQLEAAKIDESKNAAVIQVVDKAMPAERPAGPNRPLIVLVGAVLGTIGGFVLVFAGNAVSELKKQPELAVRLAMLKQSIAQPLLRGAHSDRTPSR